MCSPLAGVTCDAAANAGICARAALPARRPPTQTRTTTGTQLRNRFMTKVNTSSALPVDPVRQFHQEAVVGPQAEQIAQVAAEPARALDVAGALAPLAPHHEQRRAGPVFPAKHDIGAEL